MSWNDLIPDRSGLLPGADAAVIKTVEAELGTTLPQEFVDFLLWADGGLIAHERFIIYSAGAGIHPAETLLAANRDRGEDFPLILVAREAEEEFGFRKSDLPAQSAPVYVYLHEWDEIEKIAGSFREFVAWMFQQASKHT